MMITMMTIESLKDRWHTLGQTLNESAYQRIDSAHPLDLYIGHDMLDAKELMLLVDREPSRVSSCRSISVQKGRRQDGKWAVRFSLIDLEQEAVFIHLCWDLIESSREIQNRNRGNSFVLSRFRKWQRLMEYGHDGLLSKTVVKGLIGELLFLKQYILSKFDPVIAVEGWLGPDGADRDFVYRGIWYEVKSIDPGTSSIRISSVEQLDVDDPGELVVMMLEKTSSSNDDSLTLPGIVHHIRYLLQESPLALEQFDDKLLGMGFMDRKEYEEDHYVFRGIRRFVVARDFPRIRKGTLPPCISAMTYELSVSCLSKWEIGNGDEENGSIRISEGFLGIR